MNIEHIDRLLRNRPAVATPAGLLEDLIAEISLPRVETESVMRSESPWFKRWLPALSFATIFLVCVVAIAMQGDALSALRKENGKLRTARPNLAALQADNAEYRRLSRENEELDRLRRDNAELKQLNEEVTRLHRQMKDATALRAENARLLAINANASRSSEPDFFGEAKAKAERIMCVNNLKQIGLAARVWANDNHDVFPTNFISMTNEMATWRILQCPSDQSHAVNGWPDVEAGHISYIMDAPGISLSNPQVIFVECPIHHAFCLMDGSVQLLSAEGMAKRVKMVNGLKVFE